MLLSQLYDDALLALFPFCTDRSLANLAQTCHRLQKLSEPELTDRQYRKRWSTLRLAWSAHWTSDWSHPIEILAAIRDDSRIVKFVKRIEFSPSDKTTWREPRRQYNQNVVDLLESFNYLEDDINKFTFLTKAEKRAWKKKVEEFEPNICFLVLLSLCKDTEELCLTDPCETSSSIDPYSLPDLFIHAACNMITADKKAPNEHTKTGVMGHFPAVTRLELSHWDSEGGMPFWSCKFYLLVPSLRIFHGFMLGEANEYEDLGWPDDPVSCKLEEVMLHETLIRPSALVELVSKLPCLKELAYGGRYDFEDWDEADDWGDIEGYAESLKEHGGALFRDQSYRVVIDKFRGSSQFYKVQDHDFILIQKVEPKD